jgi:hypothetical protein
MARPRPPPSALSPAAALSTWHLGVLVLVTIIGRASALSVSVFCSDPPPDPAAADPDGGRVLSRVGAADHEVTPEAPWTGSGWREYSYGGFGGGHPHFHLCTGGLGITSRSPLAPRNTWLSVSCVPDRRVVDEALAGLAEAAEELCRLLDRLFGSAVPLAGVRDAGRLSSEQVVPLPGRLGVIGDICAASANLADARNRFRRAVARALYGEEFTMGEIARVLGGDPPAGIRARAAARGRQRCRYREITMREMNRRRTLLGLLDESARHRRGSRGRWAVVGLVGPASQLAIDVRNAVFRRKGRAARRRYLRCSWARNGPGTVDPVSANLCCICLVHYCWVGS